MSRFLHRLRQALWGIYNDGCLGAAKGAAYSALLAFFPVVTTLTTVLVQANAEQVSKRIADFLFEVVPPGTDELLRHAITERGSRPASLPIAAGILSLWAASGVMISLMEGFQFAYNARDPRGVIRKRVLAVFLVIVAALPTVGASALVFFGTRFEDQALQWLGMQQAGEVVGGGVRLAARLARYAVALGTTVLVTALLYWLAPTPRRRWRTVWPGAWLATWLWLLTTLSFGWYVRHLANYNVLYGSIGTAIALLVWMYLLAVIALLGCEYNAAAERR